MVSNKNKPRFKIKNFAPICYFENLRIKFSLKTLLKVKNIPSIDYYPFNQYYINKYI